MRSCVLGFDFGSVNVNIIAPNGTCSIQNLDNRGNTFAYGQLDEFTGDELQGCLEFDCPNNQIDYVILNHSGWVLTSLLIKFCLSFIRWLTFQT